MLHILETYPLAYPVLHNGKQYREISLRVPNGMDLKAVEDLPPHQQYRQTVALCLAHDGHPLPSTVFESLDVRTINKMIEAVAVFSRGGPPTGTTSDT